MNSIFSKTRQKSIFLVCLARNLNSRLSCTIFRRDKEKTFSNKIIVQCSVKLARLAHFWDNTKIVPILQDNDHMHWPLDVTKSFPIFIFSNHLCTVHWIESLANKHFEHSGKHQFWHCTAILKIYILRIFWWKLDNSCTI